GAPTSPTTRGRSPTGSTPGRAATARRRSTAARWSRPPNNRARQGDAQLRAGAGMTSRRRHLVTSAIVAVAGAVSWSNAHAGPLHDAIDGLASSSDDKITESVNKIPALDALMDDRLRIGADGQAYIWDSHTHDTRDPLTGSAVNAPRPLKEVEVSNEIRRVADPVLAQLHLGSPDSEVRLTAAKELSTGGSGDAPALLRRALARERDPKVHDALKLAVARVDLASADPATRLAALDVIAKSTDDDFLSTLQQMLAPGDSGIPRESDARVRAAAVRARDAIVSHQKLVSFIGDLLHGLS